MFEIEKTFHFEAGHSLVYHDGKCKEPHGHSYKLKVRIGSESLISDGPKKNMVIDFQDISAVVEPMIENYLDHHWLNTTLETDSPSAEFIAQWIYHYLKPHFPQLISITLYETPTSMVEYR